jgi:hypothetical protein
MIFFIPKLVSGIPTLIPRPKRHHFLKSVATRRIIYFSLEGKIQVRNKRNADDVRWMTPKAFEILKREFVKVENQGTQQPVQAQVLGTQVPNVPSHENEGAAVAAEADSNEIKVKRPYNRKPVEG